MTGVDEPRAVGAVVERAARGDADAWHELVDRYANLLWSIARAHRLDDATAADVVQTCWLRLVEQLGRLTDPERVGAWLATTARRECLRQIRRSAREQVSDDESLDVADATSAALDASLLLAERDALLWQALGDLGERCRELLRVLMADPAPSYDEVSAALGMPVGSIGPTRMRCLAKLRDIATRVGLASSE